MKFTIRKIKGSDGSWIEGGEQIAEEAELFFRQLLTAEEVGDVGSLLQNIPCLVSPDNNVSLFHEVTMEEVKGIMFGLNKESKLGPNGFIGVFFMHCWKIVAEDVLAATGDFMAGIAIPKGITSTLIVLIPKKPNPSTFVDFRPISLCNFINKIFTKLLANKLQFIYRQLRYSSVMCYFVNEYCQYLYEY